VTLTDRRQKVAKYAYEKSPALACMHQPPLRVAGKKWAPEQSISTPFTLNVRGGWKLPQMNSATFPPITSSHVAAVPRSPETVAGRTDRGLPQSPAQGEPPPPPAPPAPDVPPVPPVPEPPL